MVEDVVRGSRKFSGGNQPQVSGNRDDLKKYAQQLLESLSASASESVKANEGKIAEAMHGQLKSLAGEEEDSAKVGCRVSVEIMTRNSKKGQQGWCQSCDIDVYKVCVSAGGDRTGRCRAQRAIQSVEGAQAIRNTRRSTVASVLACPSVKFTVPVHAEDHSSFVSSSLRTTFALDIPSDATPAFHVCLGDQTTNPAASSAKPGGFEWKVRLSLLVAIASEKADIGTESVRMRALVKDGLRGEWPYPGCQCH
ncbi:hypothetical protein HGRIS_001035 [Hohenbuehelia grisea]|uniref:Uncharacterized protein n=1 Tax=Hohenbuehelia grisea TaxID=104357 RepID=A0ABR3JQ84_9AGAR